MNPRLAEGPLPCETPDSQETQKPALAEERQHAATMYDPDDAKEAEARLERIYAEAAAESNRGRSQPV